MDYRTQQQQKSSRSVVYASVAGFMFVFLVWNAYFRPTVVTTTGPVATKVRQYEDKLRSCLSYLHDE
jgi:hypothetical protein